MSKYTGALGEVLAARYLRDNGFSVLSANYRTRLGEVDIIAKEGDTVLFVEVKTRSPGMIALPLESVDREKQRKLVLAASSYLRKLPPNTPTRFDVMEVYLDDENQCTHIRHLPNAFDS